MNPAPILVCLPLVAALACACSESPTSPAGPSPSTASTGGNTIAHAEAKALFESLCFTCHGLSGHGDGPGAAALDPKPRSFADAAWQDSVTDEHIQKVIVFGGAAVGKSPIMPAQPQLKGKADVLAALTKIVRGFRGE